ncbi:hypothetical protein [Sphingobium sp. TKS]|uniref:hypothetical protein n=1 Tax=Sphingobium sp. TKS TaxID=1315974 RepID=UPI00077068C6|nr:hypothetical protein [Sphingobium sp. TKS]AMK25830.1 hypothetical protein K426_24634 [Sphingobium sp. TKS]
MMRKPSTHPDQLPLGFGKDAEIERIIEARVAIRAEAEAIRWRFRLMVIETILLTSLVIVTGLMLHQPPMLIARGAVLIGVTCLSTGLLLILLTGLTGKCLSALRSWKARRSNLLAGWKRP